VSFQLTSKQREIGHFLSGPQRHFLIDGGARSGKTFYILRAIVIRANKSHGSRHAVLRQAFSHVKASVVADTFPKMMRLCFPDVKYHLNRSDWYATLPNGSEIWFGGLDEGDRTEKILGMEFATIFLNECSQIPIASRELVRTRLAQKAEGIVNKMIYDANPPSSAHWIYKLFYQGIDPMSGNPLPDPENYAVMKVNPMDNRENLDEAFMSELQALPSRLRKRFWLGEYADATEHALWLPETIDRWRIIDGELPEMRRIVVAVDPSGTSGDEDAKGGRPGRSDEVGIVVCALGDNGHGYVLEDLSGNYSPSGEHGWGHMVAEAFDRHDADMVVAETNYGGDMVQAVIKAANSTLPFTKVTATRGKVVRAEPVAELYAQGKIHHHGRFDKLEDQMLSMTTHGYEGDKSPDRLDAMVWGISYLFPRLTKKKRRHGIVHESASAKGGLVYAR
jgi:phage terminase large subunit-like protein